MALALPLVPCFPWSNQISLSFHFCEYRLGRCAHTCYRRYLVTAIGVEGVTAVVEGVVDDEPTIV